MSAFVLLLAAYISLAVFLAALVYRTVQMARLPVHLRWELAPVPHEKGKNRYGGSYFEEFEWWTKPRESSLSNEIFFMFQEIVFLKSVWEHNRRLWWFSFPFHFGMYLLIGAAGLLFFGAMGELAGWHSSSWVPLTVVILGLAALGYTLGTLGALGLLLCRLFDPRLRPYSTGAALFNLVFLLAVFVSGYLALMTSGDFSGNILVFFQGLLSANNTFTVPVPLAAHLILVCLFLAYLPFTPMLHFVAKYFTYHRIRWDDAAMTPGSRTERQVLELLKQPVTWASAHLQADGHKNWVDIASPKVEE